MKPLEDSSFVDLQVSLLSMRKLPLDNRAGKAEVA